MHPILLKCGPLAIYSYGVMVALGFGIASTLIYRRASELNVDKGIVLDLLIVILISGIIGGRLFFVLLNLGYYARQPLEIFMLWKGGLAWFGGFFAALAATVVCSRMRGLDFWLVADLAAPYAALGQAFGRVGCYLNGCCYGIGRHPVQLYSASLLAAIFVVLVMWQKKRRFKGEVFLGYCIVYPFQRFFIEFLRGDNPKALWGLTIFQLISIAVFFCAFLLFSLKAREWKKRNSHSR